MLHHLSPTKSYKRFLGLLREYYAAEGLIEPEQKYQKVVDGAKYYLTTKPMHALRHSGCHYMMRSSSNNASIVAKFGWEDISMVTDVYASISVDSILDQGICCHCNPPRNILPDADLIFCSLRHAVAYHSVEKEGTVR